MFRKGLTVESTEFIALPSYGTQATKGDLFLISAMTKRRRYAHGYGRRTWRSSSVWRRTMV